jgi:curved DNA-binding protein CbpA
MPVEDARRLLGVGPEASLAEIRDAHRRLIARVHPDSGGSAELANRVNVARDTLVAEMNRRTPRAS